MRNLLVLAWWLSLLMAAQAAGLVLEGSRPTAWGLSGYIILKLIYLGFATVVMVRARSFRAQRNFETLAESFHRAAGKDIDPAAARRESRLNPLLDAAMLALATLDCAMAFAWDIRAWRASILFDALIGILMIRWVARACWLRSRGARERLKAAVDDARSRARAPDAEPEAAPLRVSPVPYLALALAAGAFAAGIGLRRWADAPAAFRGADLERCMDRCMLRASEGFYQRGEGRFPMGAETCVKRLEGRIELALDWRAGGLRLRAAEAPASDYFGNGRAGDEALWVDAEGRFHRGPAERDTGDGNVGRP